MELSEALHAKQEIFSALGLSYVRTRAEGEPSVAVGISVAEASADGFRVAVRAESREELERAKAQGDLKIYNKYPESALDIRFTGPISVQPPDPVPIAKKKLSIGASVGHYLCTAGTLGFFARRGDGTIGIVSNNHVLAAADEGKEGDAVLHPGVADKGSPDLDVVAYLAGDYPHFDDEALVVDCAFARLREGIDFEPSEIAPGLRLRPELVPLEVRSVVLKRGRTTGLTRGRISAFGIDHHRVRFGCGFVFFDRQIEIVSVSDDPFSRPGDSGSVVVNPDGHPAGLLASAAMNCSLSWANPFGEVLTALGVTVLT